MLKVKGRTEVLRIVVPAIFMNPRIPVFQRPAVNANLVPATIPIDAALIPAGMTESIKGSNSYPIFSRHSEIRGW